MGLALLIAGGFIAILGVGIVIGVLLMRMEEAAANHPDESQDETHHAD